MENSLLKCHSSFRFYQRKFCLQFHHLDNKKYLLLQSFHWDNFLSLLVVQWYSIFHKGHQICLLCNYILLRAARWYNRNYLDHLYFRLSNLFQIVCYRLENMKILHLNVILIFSFTKKLYEEFEKEISPHPSNTKNKNIFYISVFKLKQ